MKPGEHGPDELYEKFHVYKAKKAGAIAAQTVDGVINTYWAKDRLGADGEFLFVLRPETNDKAAQQALAEYARCCEGSYPELAASIVRELTRIDARVKAIMQLGGSDEDTAYRVMAEWRKDPSIDLLAGEMNSCPHCGATEGEYCRHLAEGKPFCEFSGHGP